MDMRASAGISAGQSNEHLRNWSERGWEKAMREGFYDRSRSPLNFEIGPGGEVKEIDRSRSIPQRMAEALAARGIIDPNLKKEELGKKPDRRTVVNFIFGGSPERINALAFGDQPLNLEHGADNSHIQRLPEIEQWAKDVHRFACDKWGEENVIAFVVHLDESWVHAHCTVLPITPSNKFSFKKIFAGADRFEMSERTKLLHDEFAKVNERWGLERGTPVSETGAKHRTAAQYRADRRREYEELGLRIGERRMTLAELDSQIAVAERRVKGLTTMVRNLEQQLSDLEDEIETLNALLENGTGDADELRRQLADLESQLEETKDSLADKRRKLNVADRQLEQLNSEIQSAKARNEDLKKLSDLLAGDVHKQMRLNLTDAVFGKVAAELKIMINTLTPSQKAALPDDFLETIATRPMDLMKTAMLLMAGYVDGAIQFAQSTGGGGGTTSDLRWGRDPNEDDRHFAFRCMMQARKLLKPAPISYRRGRG